MTHRWNTDSVAMCSMWAVDALSGSVGVLASHVCYFLLVYS